MTHFLYLCNKDLDTEIIRQKSENRRLFLDPKVFTQEILIYLKYRLVNDCRRDVHTPLSPPR